MADIKVYMKELGGASWTDVSSSCVKSNFKIRKGFGSLGSDSDVSKLSIEYKADDLASATLFHTTAKQIRIEEDGNEKFEGYTLGDASVKTSPLPSLAWVKLSAYPYAHAFEESIAPSSELLEGFKVLDPADADNSLFHILLNRIISNLEEPYKSIVEAYNYEISSDITISSIANPVLVEEGESYLDILNELCSEFGLSYYFDGNIINVVQPYADDDRTPITIAYNEVLINPSLKNKPYKKEKKYALTVGKVVAESFQNVYSLRDPSEAVSTSEQIPVGGYYPEEGNLEADYSTNSESDTKEFLYATGLSYHYSAKNTQNQYVNLVKEVEEIGSTSATFRFRNANDLPCYLNMLNIMASTVYYKDTSLTVTESNSKAREIDEYETRFLSTSAEAESYIKHHHAEDKAERFSASFSSDKVAIEPNSLVTIGTIPFTILVRYTEENLATGITEYSGVAYSVEAIGATSVVKKNSATGALQYISLSLDGFAYTYDSDGNLSPADQSISATVKRFGIADNPVWKINGTEIASTDTTINVPASYMTGHFITVSVAVGEFESTSYIYKVADGKDGEDGKDGKDGEDGKDGRGIDSIDYSYALSTTNNQPADSQFTDGVKTMTSTNRYLWQKEVISYTTGDPKTTVALIGVYGDTGNTGNGISGIAYYYALSTTSTQPSSITSTTLPIMTSTNRYLWQKEVISYTNGTSKTTVALIGVYGDKGDKGEDSKLIRLVADKTSFSLDSNGEPYEGQVITVSVDKQNISASHTFESDEIGVADNTTEFEITPQMMGLKPIELTNLLDEGFAENLAISNTWASDATWNGFSRSGASSTKSLLGGHIYYAKIEIEYTSSTLATLGIDACYPMYLADSSSYKYFSHIYVGDKRTLGNLTKPKTDANSAYPFYCYFTDDFAGQTVNLTVNRSIYDITDLIASSPKLQAMSDAELETWCNTYIPFVGAGETWTIGGKAKNLELLYWVNHTTPVEGQPGVYKSTSTTTAVNPPYARFALSSSDKEGHMLCARVATKRIDGDASFKARVPDGNGWNYSGWGRLEKSFSTEWESYTGGGAIYSSGESQGWIHVYPFYESSSFPTVNTTFHNRIDNVFNLTTSGWLAQLSLMGIESNADIKTFIDKYVPFFEGELAFPRLEEINIKVSADSHSDYLTIKASVQPRSLFLTSQPSKIELDAYGHAIEDEFKVVAHTQNIHGNLTWTNNKGLPIKAGKVQTFHASEMGLRPIELTQMLSDTFEDSSKWSYSSQSISVANGVITQVTEVGGADYVNSKFSMSISEGRRYYIGVNIDSVSEILGQMRIYLRNSSGPIVSQNGKTLTSAMVGKRYSAIVPSNFTGDVALYFGVYYTSSSVTATYSEPLVIDITDLIASSPKLQAMTDAELQTWCDTYIPFIGANSTWTIGGKAKNLIDNPTSSDGWTCGNSVTGFSASNGIVTGTSALSIGGDRDGWLKKAINSPIHIGDSLYAHISSISATNTYAIGQSYWRIVNNNKSGVMTITRANPEDYWLTVASQQGSTTTITIDTTKGINFINLTTSGWLAQLSLMGIEGADSVKAWIDANCPFFTGEFEFPSYKDVTWSAEYEELSDTITVKTEMSVSAQPTYIKQVYAIKDLVSVTTRPDGTALVKGDYLLATVVDAEGKTFHLPYMYNGVAWINMKDSNLPSKGQALLSVLDDILTSDSTVPEVSAIWGFFDNLVANQAFLSFLEAKNIHLTGAIYGGAYDENGNNDTGGAGFFLGKDGLFKAVKATIDDVQITGELISENFSTIATDTTVLAFTLPEDDVTYYMRNKYVEQDFADFFFDRGYTGTISVSGTFKGTAFTSINLVDDYTVNGNSLSNGVLTLYRVFRAYGDLVNYDLYYTVTYGGQTFDSRQAKYIYETSIADNNDWDIIDSYKTYKATGTVMGAGVTLIGTSDNPIWVKSNDPSSIFRQFLFTQGANSVLFKVASTNAGGGYYACDIEFVESIDGVLAENIYRMSETSAIGKKDEPFKEIYGEKVYGAVFN